MIHFQFLLHSKLTWLSPNEDNQEKKKEKEKNFLN